MKIIIFILLFFSFAQAQQNTFSLLKVGSDHGVIDPSACLEIKSTTGALLLPRMTTTQKNALSATNGDMVYDSTLGQISTYIGGAWSESSGTVTNVTASLPMTVTNGTSTPNISMPVATTSQSGYLASSDWTTFNGKQATISVTAPIVLTGAALSAAVPWAITAPTSTTTGEIIKGASSQSNDLVDWENSTGSILSEVNSVGKIGIGTTVPGAMFEVINTASTTTSGAIIKGIASQSYDLLDLINSSGTILSEFNSAGDLGVGTSSPSAMVQVNTATTTTTGLIVQGISSQSNDLQEWDNSSGTILSRVSSSGEFYGNGGGLTNLSGAASYTAPSISQLTTSNVGTLAGYLFQCASCNATAGAIYTNNSHNYTVLGTISSGKYLFTSSASTSAPSAQTGTLAKSSGTGDSSISFINLAALYEYTTPSSGTPLYLKVTLVGDGGGGAAGGSASFGSATIGEPAAFGINCFIAYPGNIATSTSADGGAGGPIGTSGSPSCGSVVVDIAGGVGMYGSYTDATITTDGSFITGGNGGTNPFGGAGSGNYNTNAGTNGVLGSGAGGGGGGSAFVSATAIYGGGGGGAGEYVQGIIPSPGASTTFYYALQALGIGAPGGGGSAGTHGGAGGNGGSGSIIVEVYYQ